MIELPKGICYSPEAPEAYFPHDTTHLFFAKYGEDLPVWNMMWLTQPALDAGLTLDKDKWVKWAPMIAGINANLLGTMTASVKMDDEAMPTQMALRHLLTLPPMDFLARLKKREWWGIPIFEDPAVMEMVEERAHLSAGLESMGPEVAVASTSKSTISEVVDNVVYAKFGSMKREAG